MEVLLLLALHSLLAVHGDPALSSVSRQKGPQPASKVLMHWALRLLKEMMGFYVFTMAYFTNENTEEEAGAPNLSGKREKVFKSP